MTELEGFAGKPTGQVSGGLFADGLLSGGVFDNGLLAGKDFTADCSFAGRAVGFLIFSLFPGFSEFGSGNLK